MEPDSGVELDRVERLAALQDQVDEAEDVAPLKGLGKLLVGTWLALAAQLLLAGGVAPGEVSAAILGILAILGWAYVVMGGTRFALARRRLRRLRSELSALLEEQEEVPLIDTPEDRAP